MFTCDNGTRAPDHLPELLEDGWGDFQAHLASDVTRFEAVDLVVEINIRQIRDRSQP